VVGNDVGEQITTPLFFADTGFDLGLTDSYVAQEAKVNMVDFEQDLFELTTTGDIAEGWAGPIALAAGVSWRDEEIVQIVRDSTNQSSDHENGHPVLCDTDAYAVAAGLRGVSVPDCLNTVGIQYSKVSNIRGTSTVREAFVESYIPVVADQPAMQLMTLGLSTRWADYSGSGNVTAWKAGLDMQFDDSFRIRVTNSRDVRAANMSERFDRTGGIATITDPRYAETYNVTRFSGGNPSVRPEEADTITAGFVFTPTSAPNLSVSLDWYEIEMAGAIGQLGVQAVIDRCEAGAMDLCDLVTRNPVDDRLILVGDVFINIDEAVVSGSDLEIAYSNDVDWFGSGGPETVSARFFASWLDENSEILGGTNKIDRAGQTGIQPSDGVAYSLPDFKLTGHFTYSNGPFNVFVQGRYIGSGTMENTAVQGVTIEDNSVDSVLYTDLRLGYTKDLASGTTLEIYGNITNLTDEDPPITPYFSAFTGGTTQANPGLFDLLGRRYTAGFRLSF
jgi:iron complex outermembrane receptor protein